MTDGALVTDAGDPRVAEFVALNDPARRRRVERDGGYFVVEGVLAIERLLTLPGWEVRSLLLLPRVADRLAGLVADRFGGRPGDPGVPVLLADPGVLRTVVGFDLHRGALASVTRPTLPRAADLVADLAGLPSSSGPAPAGGNVGDRAADGLRAGRWAPLLLAVEGVNDHENLGALYRNAAAFGVGAVLLDPACADPFYRRSVRVSVGNVLAVPTGRLDPLPGGLAALHDAGVATVALTPAGETDLRDLDPAALAGRPVAVLVGAEGAGLTDASLAAAHHRVAIAMAAGVDSLNVATAAAVALHHLARPAD